VNTFQDIAYHKYAQGIHNQVSQNGFWRLLTQFIHSRKNTNTPEERELIHFILKSCTSLLICTFTAKFTAMTMLSIFMGFMGGYEWILILVAIIILFGGKKIPELMRGVGRGIREFKDGVKDNNDSAAKE
jgi:sec-independent protein translocase protein TatA